MSDSPLLIAGLGNPGAQYARNRHNAGFMAVDTIHESYDFGPWRAKYQGFVAEGKLARRKTYLLKPMTYMNDSGFSLGAAARFLKLPPSAIVVMHDEIDLAASKLKAKTGGGDAGVGEGAAAPGPALSATSRSPLATAADSRCSPRNRSPRRMPASLSAVRSPA